MKTVNPFEDSAPITDGGQDSHATDTPNPEDQEQALQSLVSALHIPEDGSWYQVTAYVKMAPDGGKDSTVSEFIGPNTFRVLSSREQRTIDNARVDSVEVAGHEPP